MIFCAKLKHDIYKTYRTAHIYIEIELLPYTWWEWSDKVLSDKIWVRKQNCQKTCQGRKQNKKKNIRNNITTDLNSFLKISPYFFFFLYSICSTRINITYIIEYLHKNENQDFTITFFMFLALPMCIDVQFDMAKLPINCFVAFSCGAFFYSGGALLKTNAVFYPLPYLSLLCFFFTSLCSCFFICDYWNVIDLFRSSLSMSWLMSCLYNFIVSLFYNLVIWCTFSLFLIIDYLMSVIIIFFILWK